jgi:hypothetical protein
VLGDGGFGKGSVHVASSYSVVMPAKAGIQHGVGIEQRAPNQSWIARFRGR